MEVLASSLKTVVKSRVGDENLEMGVARRMWHLDLRLAPPGLLGSARQLRTPSPRLVASIVSCLTVLIDLHWSQRWRLSQN